MRLVIRFADHDTVEGSKPRILVAISQGVAVGRSSTSHDDRRADETAPYFTLFIRMKYRLSLKNFLKFYVKIYPC